MCQNTTATTLSVAASNVTYQWYQNTTNSNSGGTAISGATTNSYTPPTSTVGTTYYYVLITNSSGCSVASNVRSVTVNPAPVITAQPNSTTQNLCAGSTATTLSVMATGATSYQWFTSTSATGTGTAIANATTASYTPDTSAPGTNFYYVVISNGSCSVSSNRTQVTVNPAPTFTQNITPGNQTICQNLKPAILMVTANNVTYQWYTNTVNSNTGGTAIPGATSSTYDPPPSSTAGVTYYYAVITSSTGCSLASDVRSITVTPQPTISSQPDSNPQNLCLNASGITLSVTASNATAYQWYYSTASTGGTITTITNATSSTYTIPTTTPFATRYYYVRVSNGTTTCSVTSSPRTPVTVSSNCPCYKPGITAGTAESTKVGITALNRAGSDDEDNWPMTRKGGHLALESQTKAFVPNRVTFDTSGNPVGISASNFVEGMMVYDITNQCMKIYTLKQGDSQMAWHCVTTPACPD